MFAGPQPLLSGTAAVMRLRRRRWRLLAAPWLSLHRRVANGPLAVASCLIRSTMRVCLRRRERVRRLRPDPRARRRRRDRVLASSGRRARPVRSACRGMRGSGGGRGSCGGVWRRDVRARRPRPVLSRHCLGDLRMPARVRGLHATEGLPAGRRTSSRRLSGQRRRIGRRGCGAVAKKQSGGCGRGLCIVAARECRAVGAGAGAAGVVACTAWVGGLVGPGGAVRGRRMYSSAVWPARPDMQSERGGVRRGVPCLCSGRSGRRRQVRLSEGADGLPGGRCMPLQRRRASGRPLRHVSHARGRRK